MAPLNGGVPNVLLKTYRALLVRYDTMFSRQSDSGTTCHTFSCGYLTALWDFSKPELSEQRFRAALATASGDDSLILQTQIARTYGIRKDFQRAQDTQAPQALAEQLRWAQEGLAVAQVSSQPAARQWEPSLRNNIGYALHQLGRYDEALSEFKKAVVLRESGTNTQTTRIAHWMVAMTLRSMQRNDESLVIQLRLVSLYTVSCLVTTTRSFPTCFAPMPRSSRISP